MKTILYLLTLSLCIAQTAFAQDDDEDLTPEQILFEEAGDHFREGDFHAAAEGFLNIRKKFPKSELVGRAHFNEALSYYRQHHYESAKKTFLEILDQPYNDRDPNNLMEPYTLYKHLSSRYLAEIALGEKDYATAEKYIQVFDKKYPYQHFCGNELAAYDMYKAVMNAKIYRARKEVKKAMNLLLPHVFDSSLASNDDVLEELASILEEHFTREQNKAEFSRALASLELKEKGGTYVNISLYGVKINVEDYRFEMENLNIYSGIELYRKMVEANVLFKKFL